MHFTSESINIRTDQVVQTDLSYSSIHWRHSDGCYSNSAHCTSPYWSSPTVCPPCHHRKTQTGPPTPCLLHKKTAYMAVHLGSSAPDTTPWHHSLSSHNHKQFPLAHLWQLLQFQSNLLDHLVWPALLKNKSCIDFMSWMTDIAIDKMHSIVYKNQLI